ncbi:two-component system response regulator YesN [Paenibacillus taihuensis]|uniref:Two-component system response regulator YesN n=1 Tax=Paenibacillus taihuensis TaxID=1156355 RepID=A0A3D9R0R9_9BACL|nr:response regulator [Paenibacillus taihuensis]REE66658.1 two-component system response regulator YesN [Paenibacillus taihuensis]
MFSLLIVDDHRHIVDSMAETISWEQLGIERVYRAYSGIEAMEVLKGNSIDIMITDIRMPGKSGLELIEESKLIRPELQSILLTGHAQFEYARRALELRAVEYLIKPVRDEELLRCIGQLTSDLRDIQSKRRQSSSNWLRNVDLLKSALLSELLEGYFPRRQTLDERLTMYGLAFPHGCLFRLILLEYEEYQTSRSSKTDKELLEYSLFNILTETASPEFNFWYGKNKTGQLVAVLAWDEEQVERQSRLLQEMLQKYSDNVKRYMKGDISIYVAGLGRFPEELPLVHQFSLKAVRMMTVTGNRYFCIEEELPEAVKRESLKWLYATPALPQLFDLGSWEGVQIRIEAIMEELERKYPYSQTHFAEVYVSLLGCFMHIAHKNGILLEDLIDNADPIAISTRFRKAGEVREWAITLITLIKENMHSVEQPVTHNRIIENAERYIREHLAENVTLQAIADQVYLHPVYLSKIYKAATGRNISDYIYEQRMERACVLLNDSRLRINDITLMVGYQSTQHFIREFKKKFGVTPNVYRSRS